MKTRADVKNPIGQYALQYCTLSNKSAQLDLQLSLGF